MKNLIHRLKSDLVLSISAAVALVSVFILLYVFFWAAPSLDDQMRAPQQDITQIRRYLSQTVQIPDPRPNQPPISVPDITVNANINEQLERIAQEISGEFEQIESAAVERNRVDHEFLMENLFPSPLNPGIPHEARAAYIVALQNLLLPPSEDHPGLNAGLAPTQERIRSTLEALRDQEVSQMLGPAAAAREGQQTAELNEQEREHILQTLRNAKLEMIKDAARSVHVFVDSRTPGSDNFPFSFVNISTSPRTYELWEAQMQLWILRDMVRAIEDVNETGNPATNVTNSPVKRIYKLEVLPGFVGVHTQGGLSSSGQAAGGRTGGGGTAVGSAVAIYERPAPAGTRLSGGGEDMQANLDLRMPENFLVGPTGRMSNPIYDVRHVRLRAIVDFHELTLLMEAISQVNFMSVIKCDIHDVDEYEHLEQGYYYGPGDMVEVDMVIESLWLRSWTVPKMPDQVKLALGVVPSPEQEQPVDDETRYRQPDF